MQSFQEDAAQQPIEKGFRPALAEAASRRQV